MKIKSVAILVVISLLTAIFSCCGADTQQSPTDESSSLESSEASQGDEAEKQDEEDLPGDYPYLSISYSRDNPETVNGREKVFYTYDINTKQLTEECVLPFKTIHASGYTSGVVSRYDNAIYYQDSTVPGDDSSGTSLWAYDLTTGEASIIDNENHDYNDILLIDSDTLLLTMLTDAHVIMPVLFDLNTKTFTYMADANNEPFIYTCGPTTPYYNYRTETFTCIYWNDEETRSVGYHAFEESIDNYVTFVSKDLVRDNDRIFSHNAKADEVSFDSAVQISENEMIVFMSGLTNKGAEPGYYRLTFNGEDTTFDKIDCPYPYANAVANLCTIDGGKTFYFHLKRDDLGNREGIYSYDTETDELTPILLNDPEVNGSCGFFSIVGPGCETYEEWTAEKSSSQAVSGKQPTEKQPTESEPEVIVDESKYMPFEEITELGYIPLWMQPHSVIIYDEEGKPTITEGGALAEEDLVGRDDIAAVGFLDTTDEMAIVPNTKVEYELHGFIQNIYYRIPGTDKYQLDPDVSWALSSSSSEESKGTD